MTITSRPSSSPPSYSPSSSILSSSKTNTYNNNNNNQSKPPPLPFTTNFLISFTSGSLSGALSSVVCAPLDIVKTRLQVQGSIKTNANQSKDGLFSTLSKIVHRDGIKGLFRGVGPTLATVPTFWGIYFPMYEFSKGVLNDSFVATLGGYGVDGNNDADYGRGGGERNIKAIISRHTTNPPTGSSRADTTSKSNPVPNTNPKARPTNNNNNNKSNESPIVHVLAAVSAGAVSDCITNPLWVIRTRMQTESMHRLAEEEAASATNSGNKVAKRGGMGMIQTIKHMYLSEGIPVFWRGLTASLLGLSHVAIQFPVYEHLKQQAREAKQEEDGPIDWLFASAASKVTACLITYPHEVIRSRMMDARGAEAGGRGLIKTTRDMIRKEGVQCLYSGIHVSLIRVIPNCCLTFISYEVFTRWARRQFVNEE